MEWSDEELESAVKAYLQMLSQERRGERSNKAKTFRDLAKRHGRSPKAFEYRMQNISSVLSLMGRSWVSGLKPASHVGVNVIAKLEAILKKLEGDFSPSIAEFEYTVSTLRRAKSLNKPSGTASPERRVSQTAIYSRDPQVVAWVLNNSKGSCECCSAPAPFLKPDGDYYLEVHHLRPLADGGSDTISNSIAVCPNCHRMLHYSSQKLEELERIYAAIDRLVIE